MTAGGVSAKRQAFLEDISTGGMGLRTDTPFAVGSTLQIEVRDQTMSVTIRHCSRVGFGYQLGVELVPAPPERCG